MTGVRDLARDLADLRRFAFLTLPGYSMIACANAVEALRMANRLAGEAVYAWQIVTPDGQPAAASNGLLLHPTEPLDPAKRPDLLLACGGVDVRHAVDRWVTAALRRLARGGVALGALCTGSLALADAGLLEGYRCAIHWENLAAIREEFPRVRFVEDVFAFDRDRATCTGGVAPLHMMLAVIEARLGRRLAAGVRAQFLIERARAAEERQPARLGLRITGHPRLEAAVRLIEEGVETPMPSSEVARTVRLSPRQLERLFKRHLGQTPGAYAAALRLDRARVLLRETAMPITAVGVACGYASLSRFSAAYRARFGHPPRTERTTLSPGHQDARQPHPA